MRKLLVIALCALAIATACGGSSSLDVRDYDRSCKNANDCVLVATDACCGCLTSAINAGAQAQYAADLANAKKNCSATPCSGFQCVTTTPGCLGGVCIANDAIVDASDQ